MCQLSHGTGLSWLTFELDNLLRDCPNSSSFRYPELVPDVSICICTYRRPEGLRSLLRSLNELVPATPLFEIVVIDNDAGRSGERVLTSNSLGSIQLSYLVEPVKNIARARNRAIAAAQADLIAFIDDDEIAEPQWLLELHNVLVDHDADAVFGPVVHRFATPPPRWLKDLEYWHYQVPKTGQCVTRRQLRSGNVLFRKCLTRELTHLFDEDLGLSGGEDTDFFSRMGKVGGKLVAAQAALVHETVSEERMTLRWLVRRYYRNGIETLRTWVREEETTRLRPVNFLREIVKVILHSLIALVCIPFSRTRSVKNLLRAVYSCGICSGRLGFRFYEYGVPRASVGSVVGQPLSPRE